MLMFLSERGAQPPSALCNVAARRAHTERFDALVRCLAIAEALAENDNGRLAAAIDDAEAHGLISHAARMHVVLAQPRGDHAQLERSRLVLERLSDRQFRRRLDEVAAMLR